MEIAATIIALTIPTPVRVASDSIAVVNTFARMLRIAARWKAVDDTEWWPKKGPRKKL